jgi:hypothetical protein
MLDGGLQFKGRRFVPRLRRSTADSRALTVMFENVIQIYSTSSCQTIATPTHVLPPY